MVKYVTMKRITQILASIVFVITVLTVYLAFDFAINNAVSSKNSSRKRSLRDPANPPDDIKITKRRSVSPQIRRSNRTMKNHDDDEHPLWTNERRAHKLRQLPPLRAKPGTFHKGKTGVKVNKPRKLARDHRKRNGTTFAPPQRREKVQLEGTWRV